jgi:hypothetical protein
MSLAALARCCPTWADFQSIDGREAHVDVVAVRASKTLTRLFELRLVHLSDDISVFERVIGSTLPTCCPERHINPDGSFCIGLRGRRHSARRRSVASRRDSRPACARRRAGPCAAA